MKAITQIMRGMFLRCARQCECRYLRGEIIPPGIAARRGSATHKAAQLNHEQKLRTQADLPLGDLQDAARDHYVKLVKEEGVFVPKGQLAEKDRLLWGGLEAAGRLTRLYREALAPTIQPVLVEEKLTLDAGLGPAPADSPQEKRGSPQGPGTIPLRWDWLKAGLGSSPVFRLFFQVSLRTAPENRTGGGARQPLMAAWCPLMPVGGNRPSPLEGTFS